MCDAMGSSSLKQDDTTCEQEESALPHYNYTHKIYVREKRRERRRKTVASSQKTECHVLWRLIRFVILLRHESYVCGCGCGGGVGCYGVDVRFVRLLLLLCFLDVCCG